MRRILFALIVVLCLSPHTFASMWLKQNTATTIRVGPFHDATDGKTREKDLNVTFWTCTLFKGTTNSTLTITASGGNNDAVHLAEGNYSLELTAGNTDTLGLLSVDIEDANTIGAWHDYMVVPANVWDSMFGADYLQIDNAQWLGQTIAAVDTTGYPKVTIKDGTGTGEINTASGTVLAPDPNGQYFVTHNEAMTDDDVTAAVPSVVQIAAANWGALLSSYNAAGTFGEELQELDPNVTAILADTSAYDTDVEYATAIWNAAVASYGSAGSYGLLFETNLAWLTGNSFTRLGAPVGASISADIAAISGADPNAVLPTTVIGSEGWWLKRCAESAGIPW